MAETHSISCRCGATQLVAEGEPILVVECMCDSCRKAGAILEGLAGAPKLLDDKQATLEVLYRRDKVSCAKGAGHLKEFLLAPDSKTRRIVADCCNSAMLLDFSPGHWINIYGQRWPEETRPAPTMRTMVGDMRDPSILPPDIPNLKSHSLGFYWRLISAWAAMGFRNPKPDYVNGTLDVR